jgi:ribonuclease P protein component
VLTRRADFLAANRGLRVARPGFVLLANPNAGLGKRYGVTVTKKIGNAVVRNRMKRRFRELLRAALPEAGLSDHDHVLIGREGGIERDFAQLREELSAALARAAAGKGDKPRGRKVAPRHGEGDHAKHGGGARAGDSNLEGRDQPRVPLHHPAGGPPPPSGEE